VTRLVVAGTRTWDSGLRAAGVCVLSGLGCSILFAEQGVPWLPRSVPPELFVIASLPLAAAIALVIRRRGIACAGRVTLEGDVLEFERSLWRARVQLSDLAGYRDGDPDFVELIRRRGARRSFFFPRLTIPTCSEEARVQVLRALDARGLERLE